MCLRFFPPRHRRFSLSHSRHFKYTPLYRDIFRHVMARGARGSKTANRTYGRAARLKRGEPARKIRTKKDMRAEAPSVLAFNVAKAPGKAFGAPAGGPSPHTFDARSTRHVPLPRSIGSYTVIRTTRRISSNKGVMAFGAFKQSMGKNSAQAGRWTNICAYGDVVRGTALNGASNAEKYVMPMNNFGTAFMCVPSGITVQVMNPNSLQTTEGVLYATVPTVQLKMGGDTRTWDQLGTDLISYQSPKLISAPSLALKGMVAHSFPINMEELAQFTSLEATSDGTFTYDTDEPEPTGWAPIIVYNAGSNLDIEYLVTMEWRVRFDPNNPASSMHRDYGYTSQSAWDSMVRGAKKLGEAFMSMEQDQQRAIIGAAAHAAQAFA